MHSIVLACDTSAYEIGAVLSHNFVNGSEKPIGFTECMSFKNINRYVCREEIPHSQVEKRSSMYFQSVTILYLLFGHKFTLVTENKAVMSLFVSSRKVLLQASVRIQYWS